MNIDFISVVQFRRQRYRCAVSRDQPDLGVRNSKGLDDVLDCIRPSRGMVESSTAASRGQQFAQAAVEPKSNCQTRHGTHCRAELRAG